MGISDRPFDYIRIRLDQSLVIFYWVFFVLKADFGLSFSSCIDSIENWKRKSEYVFLSIASPPQIAQISIIIASKNFRFILSFS